VVYHLCSRHVVVVGRFELIPGRADITLYQGDDFDYTFRLRGKNADGTPGSYLDLTGFIGKAEIRSSAASATALATFSVAVDADQSANRGVVHMSLGHTATAALPVTTSTSIYKWDVQLTTPSGKIQTYLSGDVKVIAEITRP
jgi:hypothetical protein